MAFVRRLISLMGLLLFASACSANGRYRDVPYDPPIDFPKLADDIGIAQQSA